MITKELLLNDSKFLASFRAISIFVIVFGHVGGFWVFRPYSEFLHVFVPIFFFLSGAVSFFSYNRTHRITEYYEKRFLGLLVPYYLLCILSLFVFVVINKQLPTPDMSYFLKCIQIRPSNAIMPFSFGQVWFLHTLFFITLMSPLYFFLQRINKYILPLIMTIIVMLSGVQLILDIDNYFIIAGNNLYRPLIHSSFYIFGIICFSSDRVNRLNFLAPFFVFCVVVSVFLVYFLNLNIDYAFHIYAPDLYYVLGSLSAIIAALIVKNNFVKLIQHSRLLEKILWFFHKHTFSIFLLHTFSIFISEELFGLVDPPQKTITYGLIKLVVVLAITCTLAIPFTQLSVKAISLLRKKEPNKATPPAAIPL
jgi:peptidoglycan/LPS O-acetylase OafA/YrhL